MNFSDEQNFASYFIVLAVMVITILALWNTSLFLQRLKNDERTKIEIWAQSQKALNSEQPDDYLELSLLIGSTNNSIPIIITDANGNFIKDSLGKPDPAYFQNLPQDIVEDEQEFISYLHNLRSESKPIELDLVGSVQYIYYGNSDILNKLKYYPIAIALIIFLLIGVIYFFFTTSKASEQNKLWAGMAKETAHQIGTPLSSLVGWNEILKTEQVNPEYITEIEKDIAPFESDYRALLKNWFYSQSRYSRYCRRNPKCLYLFAVQKL